MIILPLLREIVNKEWLFFPGSALSSGRAEKNIFYYLLTW